MLTQLLKIELLKTKRSLALLMMFLSPAMVILVNCLVFINNQGVAVEKNGWGLFWSANFSMWGYFMMPLYVALVTALLNGIEHNSNGWRHMLSLPVKLKDLFLVKLILAMIFLIGASLTLFFGVFTSILLFKLLGYQGDDLINIGVIIKLVYACISSFSILTIQHIVSWRWENIVISLGLGVIATMSIIQFSSSQYWYLNPWSYTLISTNSPSIENQFLALIFSVTVGLVLTITAIKWLKTREIKV